MKTFFFTPAFRIPFIFPFLISLLNASTYYVSPSGSDQAGGKTDTSAFATLGFARTKLASRDTLLLLRGSVFRESLDVTGKSDPCIRSYGNAALASPIINGSIAITGWSRYQGDIWVAACPKNIQKLFVNNKLMPLARFPDTGWLTIDSVAESSDGSNTTVKIKSLTQRSRNSAEYWTNAQVRWRRWSWWFETRKITSYAQTGVLTLAEKSENHIMGDSSCKGWHLYIDNKFEELDAPGEWFYDSAAQKVYLYPPGGVNPATLLIEGACRSTGLTLAGGSVDNIWFQQQNISGLSFSKKSTITNCRFDGIGSDAGGSALSGSWDIADSRAFGNVFRDNLNTGISWYENSGRKGQSVIQNDSLFNTGVFPGYGGTGSWHGVGILVHLSSNVQVRNNYIDKTGYAGILLGSDSNYVQYNIIKNAMWTLNDGAAIYTDCGRSTINNNLIYDTKGDLSSSGPWYPLGHGIWLEFLGDFRESVVENNTIVRSGANGIFLPNNFACTIKNNILFDNAEAQLCLEGMETNDNINPPRTQSLPQNNQFQGNICCAAKRGQKALTFQSQFDYGTMQGNYFCNPYTDSVVSGYGTGSNQYRLYNYTLAQWRSKFTWADASAKSNPVKRPSGLSENKPYGKGTIFINESAAAQTVALGSTAYLDINGAPVSGSISVAPFYSTVLFYADSALAVKKTREIAPAVPPRFTARAVAYAVPSPGTVTVSLFNQAGRRVFFKTEHHSKAGESTIYFNGIGAAGILAYQFSCSMQSGTFVKTGKVLLPQ